jgi:uncharacterized protein (DUF885 family)
MPPVTDTLCRSYLDLRWNFDPVAGTEAGDAGADQRLGSFDEESVRAELAAFRAMAGAVEDLDVTDLQDEIDRTALLDDIRVTIFRFQHERPHLHNPAFWLSHLFRALHSLLQRAADRPAERAAAALARLEAAPAFLAQATATIREPPSVLLETAIQMLEGGRSLPAHAAAEFGRRVPELGPALEAAASSTDAALGAFGTKLRALLEARPAVQSFSVGEDEFNRRLHYEHNLRATAPELWRYGLHLVEEAAAAVQRSAADFDPERPWTDVVRELRAERLTGGTTTAFAAEVTRARAVAESEGLVPLPEGEIRVEPTPAFLRHFVPAVWCDPPGPEETGTNGVLYVTESAGANGMAHGRHETWAWAAAEAFPGFFLQRRIAAGLPSLVRRYLWTPVTVRGWALYVEELMAEAGLARTPAERMLGEVRLLRAAVRIILDVGLHTRAMSPEDAVAYAREHLALDRTEAEEMVRRACARPTYSLADAVGRRELLALRNDWRKQAGGAAPLRDFHDAVLAYGGLPVALIRWGMGLDE